MQFRCADPVSTTYVGDECLVLDGATGACHILNETAGWLLSYSRSPVDVEATVNAACERYPGEDPNRIGEDIREAVRMLHENGLVTVVD